MDIVTDIMCRKLKLKYKKDVEHDGINTLLGRHGDGNKDLKIPGNECYFMCYQSYNARISRLNPEQDLKKH